MKDVTQYATLLAFAAQYEQDSKAAIIARDRAALMAKNNGASYAEVANALGLTRAGAQDLIRRARRVYEDD